MHPERCSLTTAAQNIHIFLRKSPLNKKNFFEWLKTAISSTACGTVTLKSPLLRAFFTPHVHSRQRKHLARCTLDCGFKTPESPALRGFVAERCPIRGTSLYLVIFSNGLRHPKNLPVKFGFSPKTVPSNIAKKLPLQRCFKPFLIPLFNFSHKWHTFDFVGKSGYTLAFAQRIAHNGSHGETGGVLGGGRYHYPRHVLHVRKPPRAGYQNGVRCCFLAGCTPKNAESLGTAMRSCASLSRGVAAPLGCVTLPLLLRFASKGSLQAVAETSEKTYPPRTVRI